MAAFTEKSNEISFSVTVLAKKLSQIVFSALMIARSPL